MRIIQKIKLQKNLISLKLNVLRELFQLHKTKTKHKHYQALSNLIDLELAKVANTKLREMQASLSIPLKTTKAIEVLD